MLPNIAIAGVRTTDYKLRLMMAGVPEEKLKETSDEEGAYKLLELNDTDSIYILHELYAADTAMKLRDSVKQYINEKEA